MRVIGRALGELAGVLLAGFVGFFVGLATLLASVIGALFMTACCLASGVLTVMALFCGMGWFFTHKQHELVNAGGFLVEAAIPFMLMVVVAYYRDKVARVLTNRRARQAALRRISVIRPASRDTAADASYDL